MVPLGAQGEAAEPAATACSGGNGAVSGGDYHVSQLQAIMTFIDFEYADWAPRGFDWGNHFCE